MLSDLMVMCLLCVALVRHLPWTKGCFKPVLEAANLMRFPCMVDLFLKYHNNTFALTLLLFFFFKRSNLLMFVCQMILHSEVQISNVFFGVIFFV